MERVTKLALGQREMAEWTKQENNRLIGRGKCAEREKNPSI